MIRILFLVTTVLACALPCRAEAPPSPAQRLVDALLCKVDSLEAIRGLVEHPVPGVAATTWGQEMDERNVVIPEGGLKIAGAEARAVVSEFAAPYDGFQGIVFAEFKGDSSAVVRQLGLKTPAAEAEALGKFVLPRPTGAKDEVCPPTVVLTPLEDGRFVLGCGWCNG